LRFEKEYYKGVRYSLKQQLIKRYVLEIIEWASEISKSNLLNGQGKKALDVGCAYGYAAEVLELLGYETFGIDISKYGVKQAKKNCSGDFLVCDAQSSLSFKSETFDLVTCFDVLEHLQYPIKSIENMFEVCKNVVICTTPNRAVEKPVRKVMREFDKTHINVRLPSEWKRSIQSKLKCKLLKVETFYELTPRIADKLLFFKSFKVPYGGLTIRILVEK